MLSDARLRSGVLLGRLAADRGDVRMNVIEVSSELQQLGANILRKTLPASAAIDQEVEHVFAKCGGIVPRLREHVRNARKLFQQREWPDFARKARDPPERRREWRVARRGLAHETIGRPHSGWT